VCAAVAAAVWGVERGPAHVAYWRYAPQEGDLVFQSLPVSPLVAAIEGATGSPFSHCGLVARREGGWVVYEAYDGVEATPLAEFVFRGREQGFAAFRLKPGFRDRIPAMRRDVESRLGRPYDVRYRLDDEKLYCSELIWKAYRAAGEGDDLGPLVRLGDLRWQPFEETIRHFEQGPPPLDREMITPRDLAASSKLDVVFEFRIATPQRSE
jgi:hypothetical protein